MGHNQSLYKNPNVDLKNKYPRFKELATIISLGILTILFYAFRDFKPAHHLERNLDITIISDEIPQINYYKKPPPPNKPIIPVASPEIDSPDPLEIWDPGAEVVTPVVDNPPVEKEPWIPYYKVEKKPKVKMSVLPVYPEMARRTGIAGIVVVEVLINTRGEVEEPRIVTGNVMLNDAALEAIVQWKFDPGMQRNRPVNVRMQIPIQFKLRN